MKKNVYVLGLLALTAVTSCTDDAYDLKKENIDYSLQAGESSSILWTPDGSTSDAKLEDIFSVEEGQNLRLIGDPETGKSGLYCMWSEAEQEANVTLPAATDTWSYVTVDEPFTTVDLDDIPEFLRNEKTCFDIENPIILISVVKPDGLDFRSRIVIKDETSGKSAETIANGLEISGEPGVKKFYIAAKDVTNTYLPEEYQNDATWVPLDENKNTLQEMLRDMPDQFKIELKDYQGRGIAGTEKLVVDYTFYAPMRPGANFRLNDNDVADGFKSDLKNLLFNAIVVQADALGDLPMTVRIVPVAINEKGDAMKDVIVTVNDKPFVDVPGNKVTSLFVKLSAISGEKTSHYVKRDYNYLDGIRFDFTVMNPTTPGVKIFSDMKMRLEHMKLGVMGIGYDGN